MVCQAPGGSLCLWLLHLGESFPAFPCSRNSWRSCETPGLWLSFCRQVRKKNPKDKSTWIFLFFPLKFGPGGAANLETHPEPFCAFVSHFFRWELGRNWLFSSLSWGSALLVQGGLVLCEVVFPVCCALSLQSLPWAARMGTSRSQLPGFFQPISCSCCKTPWDEEGENNIAKNKIK